MNLSRIVIKYTEVPSTLLEFYEPNKPVKNVRKVIDTWLKSIGV